ncbi:DNA replication/repair protein RecF [uncultured Roseobacter sp.]|uniref:DNA replication/repair protein RecF n=1 Tax=uncultured Roseobacter sp. TaxID=114847 RepID=UPI0026184D0B|nr:DNA replication/repair protein RecF [uncultured Roseobacter sp.]
MALYLSALTLSHFRSHKLARLTLDGRPVALFGANGAGKTNVLEAVSLFSPGRGLRRSSAQDMTRRPEALGWKLTGLLSGSATAREIEITSEGGAARQLRIDEKPATQSLLAQLARVVWLIPAMDRLWIEGAEGRRRFLDRIALSFAPDHAEASLVYERAMRERNRLLKDQVRDAAWYGALETQMSEAGVRIDRNRQAALTRLAQAQEGAATAFPAADMVLSHPSGPLPDAPQDLRTALADSRRQDMAAGRSLLGPHRADLDATYQAKGIPARDCSTGEQKALLISVILANARALAADIGAPPILLLDEVAAHLDPDRRAALYNEIVAVGAQAWMTGTERGLFDALGDRAQYFEVTESAGVSDVAPRP